MLELIQTKRTDERLLKRMSTHYSKPKGFVGRNICYSINYDGVYYGHIVAGSATRFLPGRNEFFGITIEQLNNIVNNIFFNVSKVDNNYPVRNFTSFVVKKFVEQVSRDWKEKYGDNVLGVETLVELPRTGELYLRSGFIVVGQTKGFSCKRVGGVGTDSWGGRRVWDKTVLKPKLVLCYKCDL